MRTHRYYVYMLTNRSHRTLYIGFTNNLRRRLADHHAGHSSFTAAYRVTRLVYFEMHTNVNIARQRERTLKHWVRAWKDDLINGVNPDWRDLSDDILYD